MREIIIDLSADEAAAQYRFAGFEGEHNATKLTVILPQRLLGKEGAEYRFLFETACSEAVFSASIPLEGSCLSVKLTKQLMRAPILKAFVGCYVLQDGEVVLAAKSPEMLLGIQKSVGEETEDLNEKGGTVPGLVVENAVTDSKNPVSASAVKKSLEEKISRSELLRRIGEPETASRTAPVSEKAVADALLPYLKKEEYVVDNTFSATGKNPVASGCISEAVSSALRGTFEGEVVFLQDESPLPHKGKIAVQKETNRFEKLEEITSSAYAYYYVCVTEEVFLEIVKVEEDVLYFADGTYWRGSGQFSSTRDGVLSECFSVGDFVCLTPGDYGSNLHRVGVTKELVPVPNAVIWRYGKNLCYKKSTTSDEHVIGQIVITDINKPGEYTLSADVTVFEDDDRSNFYMRAVVLYKDGTRVFKENLPWIDGSTVRDGKPRRMTLSFSVMDKPVQEIQLSPLNYTGGGNVKHSRADRIMLEYSAVASEYEPYRDPIRYVADAEGKCEMIFEGENDVIFADGNNILSGEYNRDTGKVISRLEKSILDLGGNI